MRRRRRRQLAIFCLDLVTAITYLNQERIIFLWYRARSVVVAVAVRAPPHFRD